MFLLKAFGRQSKRHLRAGFTLIELLVVVLIIGILAAVALPQYQKAVARSRAAEAVMNASVLAQALDRYYMANGAFTTELSDLDMTPPQSDEYSYRIMTSGSSNIRVFALPQKTGTGTPSFEYSMMSDRRRWCFALVEDAAANATCKTYGPFSHTYDGVTNYYRMQ